MPVSKQLFTLGHSTLSSDELVAILRSYGIEELVDVRTVPRSRTNPQFNQDTLPETLASCGVAYRHEKGLGGLRKPAHDSINTGWRNKSFRGYADYMQTFEFEEAVGRLAALAASKTVAIMCAEAVPWRCHRSLVGDAMLVRGFHVEDIYSLKSAKPHKLTAWAKVRGRTIIYPPSEES